MAIPMICLILASGCISDTQPQANQTEPPLPPPIPALPAEGDVVASDSITGMTPHSVYQGFAESETFSLPSSYTFFSPTDTDTISLTINDDYIYRYAFISYDGNQWQQIDLTGSLTTHYITGSATATIPITTDNFGLTAPGQTKTRNYIVTYTCDSTFYCHDGWQIRQFDATLQPEEQTVYAINCGGYAYTASDGTTYEADNYYTDGGEYESGESISGTTDDALYSSERAFDFSYNFPVTEGYYNVTLKFAEVYWDYDGARIFDIFVEGDQVADDLDLYAAAGYTTAYDISHNVYVDDGSIDLGFSATVDWPKISAILIKGNVAPECGSDPDCPDDYDGAAYCSGGDVYLDHHDWSCSGGTCVDIITNVLVEDCTADETCVGGVCQTGGTGSFCDNIDTSIFDLLFCQDLEDATPGVYSYEEWDRDWKSGYAPEYYNMNDASEGRYNLLIEENTDPEQGTNVMRFVMPEGSYAGSPVAGGGGWDTMLKRSYDELYFSYRIKFRPGFEWVEGGKMPGFRCSEDWDGSLGPPYDLGGLDFSMWTMSRVIEDEDPTYPTIMHYYYYYGQTHNHGASGFWQYPVESGRWYTVTLRVVMNTISGEYGNEDTILEGYIDGELVPDSRITGFTFRNLESIGVDRLMIRSFFGGDLPQHAAIRDEWIDYDDFVAFTYNDGVDVPRGNELSPYGRVLVLPY